MVASVLPVVSVGRVPAAAWAAVAAPTPPPHGPEPLWPAAMFVPVEGTPAAEPGGRSFPARDTVPAGQRVTGIVVSYDLSEVADAVRVVRRDASCTVSGDVITCRAVGDYSLSPTPFALLAPASAPLGDAGTVTVRFTGRANLPPDWKVRLYVGPPEFHARQFPERAELPASSQGTPPPLRPAFVNTGGPAPSRVVLTVSVSDSMPGRDRVDDPTRRSDPGSAKSLKLPRVFRNCHYGVQGDTATCEFPGPLLPGHGYETDSEIRAENGRCCQAEGTYQYHVSAVEELSPTEVADYRAMPVGSGPALGLDEIDAPGLTGNASGSMSFRSADLSVGTRFHAKSATIEGMVGARTSLELPQPTATDGFATEASGGGVTVALPSGVSFAPAPEPGSFPSEEEWCAPADLSARHVTCQAGGFRTMIAVSIDRTVPGARGRVSTAVPPGDTDPSDNELPIEVVATGTAKPMPPTTTASAKASADGAARGRPAVWTDSSVLVLVTAAGAAAVLVARRRWRATARIPDGGPEDAGRMPHDA
ncbi:hypothetical protein ACFXB3_10035 [Streptomyces sp. NPDC059447]|uniref:hypothetical protein n=1 Tax=Streptomyces sp. NPDC059447 TaxID=3346834 RepID=UPI00367A3159